MSSVETTQYLPFPAATVDDADDVTLYGTWLNSPSAANKPHRALIYGFCYQGHCYRLAMPAEYVIGYGKDVMPPDPVDAKGCGYDAPPHNNYAYKMWLFDKTRTVQRIERRRGTIEDLLLDFNLPGRSPATLTYSAKVQIATKAGKIHE